jgi:hypothetical protein
MSSVKQDIEIQAVNLAQQWYSLAPEDLPDFPHLLAGYLKCFPDDADKTLFLKETLRIAEEMEQSPKTQPGHHHSFADFRNALTQRIKES